MTNVSADAVGYQTRSLIRALAILDAFGPDRPMLSVKDLHELLDVPKPTVSRLASVLEQQGFLRGAGHGYRLGPKTFALGSLFAQQYELHEAGRPPMEALARDTAQTSSLAVLSGRHVVNLIVVRPARPIHHVTAAGSREYAHLTGLGKALLSALPEESVERILGDDPYPRETPNSICDHTALHAELDRTRQRGYALDREEFALGLRCVAVPLQLPRLGPASISVSGPAADYSTAAIPRFFAALQRTAKELETAFGHAADFSLPIPRPLRVARDAGAGD
jgi:DNA-binding IclR family transcriptional regulator